MTTDVKPQQSLTNITTLMVLTRLIESTIVQLFFPFLPIIAAGINISDIQMGRLLGIQGSTSLLAPLFGATADKRGYRRLIQFALFLTVLGCIIIYFSQSLTMFIIGLMIQGIGLAGSNPMLAAYLSHLLPFEKRSWGLSFLEYAWAFTGIVMIPLMGFLIDATSWRVPFLVLGILQAIAIFAFGYLPAIETEPETTITEKKPWLTQLRNFFDLGQNWRSAWAVIAVDALSKFSGLILAYTFATWLIDVYGLGATQLGQVGLLLGGADITATTLVALTGDRVGKKRSVLIGTVCGIIFFSILPLWTGTLTTALIGLILARLSFEFTFISTVVFISEQSPRQRGKLMSLRVGFGFLSTLFSTFAGPALYAQFGLVGVSLPGAVAMALALLVTWWFTVERG